MTSRTQQELDPEIVQGIDKILEKSFADIRKRVLTLVAKHEKRIMKNALASNSKPRKSTRDVEPSKGRGRPKKEQENHKHKRSSYHRSQSSSSGSPSN